MKKIALAGVIASLVGGAALCGLATYTRGAEMPPMPKPTTQHQWLQRFVGKWDDQVTINMEPGKPPMKAKMNETFRSLGGFWVVGEGSGVMMGQRMASNLTIGYDPAQKKYIGTWIDSNSNYMWRYVGSVDSSGKVLTLMTTGPCPMKGGKIVQFKEVTEFKSNNHRVFTSSMLDEGKWTKMLTVDAHRRK